METPTMFDWINPPAVCQDQWVSFEVNGVKVTVSVDVRSIGRGLPITLIAESKGLILAGYSTQNGTISFNPATREDAR